jgi:ketol-acid reductoisomerase
MDSMTAENPGRFWRAGDADPGALAGERVAVLGYGNLGRALALNLRDVALRGSSIKRVSVGNIDDEYASQARQDGFEVLPIGQAVASSDAVLILLPDEVIPHLFASSIAPNLSRGAAILLASGYNLAYGLVAPPEGVDVLLLAPRMGGEHVRTRFLSGEGFLAYGSVEQDASGRALARLLGIADAAGALQAGVLELDARREADLDLFVEQTMGAAIGVAVMSAFALGVEAGIPAEAMVLEMYMSGEMETVFRAFRERGFLRTSEVHGPTAMYGGFVRSMELMLSDLPTRFRQTLAEIQSGEFAQRFQAEYEAGYPSLSQAQAMAAEEGPIAQPIAQAEARVRSLLGVA